jgi:hypothetical protein
MWTVKDCFVGADCWCGIIVSPDGEECNAYGEVSRTDGQYIIDALNKAPGAETNINVLHPVPWHVKMYSKPCIVTTAGLTNDKNEDSIGFIWGDYAKIFVEAVNSFYSPPKPTLPA